MRTKKNSLLLSILFIGMLLSFQSTAQEENFVVIVNEQNPANSLEKGVISNIFLKKKTRWEEGERVISVDL